MEDLKGGLGETVQAICRRAQQRCRRPTVCAKTGVVSIIKETATRLPDNFAALLPEPGSLRLGPPPHWQASRGIIPITLVFVVAATVVASSGVVLFGWCSVRVIAISVGVALLVESAFNAVKGRSPSWSESHALLIGLLFGCTLPASVSWRVVVAGAFIAVSIGEAFSGGMGNYLWHPVALGRVAVQVMFYRELTPVRWPVLAPGHLLWGKLDRAAELPAPGNWSSHSLPPGVQAWLTTPTETLLTTGFARTSDDPASALVDFVRNVAPPWRDTVTGVAGGAIGEACVAAVLVVAGLLLWRGLLRWQMVAAAVISAILAAAILPVRTYSPGGPMLPCTVPGLAVCQGLPVGAAYIFYHLTAGGFPLVVLVLAPDPSSSPLTTRGHAIFGILIGVLTIVLRGSMGVPAAAYWALLAANTLVPTINRLTRRRVLGT